MATYERSIWMNALHLFVAKYRAFRISFPLTMTTAQLEHAATRPARFAAVLRNGPLSEDVVPLATQILSLSKYAEQLEGGRTTGHFTFLRLVTGGRFLITITSTFLLQLWRLGLNPDDLLQPYPMVSTFLTADDVLDMLPQVFSGGLSLRVLVVAKIQGYDLIISLGQSGESCVFLCVSSVISFCIYTYLLRDSRITFATPAIFSLPIGNLQAYCLQDNRLAIKVDENLVVWNFVLRKGIGWRFPDITHGVRYLEMSYTPFCF